MILSVDRLDDPRIEIYARVGDPAYLLDRRLFVAEGRLVVRRLLDVGRFAIESILLTPVALAALEDVLPDAVPVYVADQTFLTGITGFNFHRGCLALARRPEPHPHDALMDARRLIALEGIGNPDNIGGIFRSAAAFGVDGVLLDPASGDPLYRKAIRTSMAAALQVPFARLEPWPDALERFKSAGFTVLGLTPRADAPPIDDVIPQVGNRWVVLVGAEGPGLTAPALSHADFTARIPMAPGVDSLNVTVATGIALSRLFPS